MGGQRKKGTAFMWKSHACQFCNRKYKRCGFNCFAFSSRRFYESLQSKTPNEAYFPLSEVINRFKVVRDTGFENPFLSEGLEMERSTPFLLFGSCCFRPLRFGESPIGITTGPGDLVVMFLCPPSLITSLGPKAATTQYLHSWPFFFQTSNSEQNPNWSQVLNYHETKILTFCSLRYLDFIFALGESAIIV